MLGGAVRHPRSVERGVMKETKLDGDKSGAIGIDLQPGSCPAGRRQANGPIVLLHVNILKLMHSLRQSMITERSCAGIIHTVAPRDAPGHSPTTATHAYT